MKTAITAGLLCLTATLTLGAVEAQLQTPIDAYNLRFGFVSEQVDKGAIRSEEPTLYGLAGIRWNNIGFQGEMWLAMQDDDSRNVDAGDNTEMRLRLDYLYEKPDFFQVIPHLEQSYYPSAPSSVDEPLWFGADFWYLMPWEGIELGGSFDLDLDNNYGWHASFGAREFYQNGKLNIDIMAWQALNFGDQDFHEAYSGADKAGLTTLELGVDVTLPLAWQNSFLTFTLEAQTWLMSDDRDALEEDSTFTVGITFFYTDKL